MQWATFYGILTLGSILCALWGGSVAPLKCGMILMVDWLVSNLAVGFLGFDRAPLIVPCIDAVAALCILSIAARAGCRTGYQIFALYVAGAVVHVTFYLIHAEGNRSYYEILNVLYALSVLLVGEAGVRHGLDRRDARRRDRARSTALGA
jgi:hypothetical protein